MTGLPIWLVAGLVVLLRAGVSAGFSHPSLSSRTSSTLQLQMAHESSLNMDDLRRRMKRQESQYARLVMEQSNYVKEGQIPKGSGTNIILAFEGEGDCVEFARALQDLEFADPSPEETVFEPFRQYCEMSGMSLMIVPKGFELTPPQLNANDYDDEDDDDKGLADDDRAQIREDLVEKEDDDMVDAWG